MTDLELKNKVIGQISNTNDINILIEVYKLLNTDFNDNEIFRLSDNHINAINLAIDQINKGDFLTNDQANKEIDEWLNK